ncbi:MAG: hypothetical protein JW751_00055 [Polyangiaceae bacterium]|nr:hypothetical protein [Polyangiaceae bacterium]
MERADAALLALLLESGTFLVDPDAPTRAALRAAEELGLVRASWCRGFPCHGGAEEEDPDAPDWRVCMGWVELPPDWVEGEAPDPDEDEAAFDAWAARETEIACRWCDRRHRLDRYPRAIVDGVGTALEAEGLRAWMAARLAALDPEARALRDGVGWRALLDGEEVAVVWLDQSQDSRASTRAFGAAQPTVYLTTEPRRWSARLRDEPNVVLLPVAEWVAGGDGVLREAALRARSQPLLVSEPGLRPWARVRSPEPLAVAWALGARVLAVEAERATLDGVEVLGREATGLLPVLRFLADRWREDVADGKAPGDHCTWSLEDIRAGLRDTEPSSAPGLTTLRRQISRLRAGIARRYLEATGVALDEDAVVQNVGGQGYRLHPGGVVARVG